MSELDDFDIFNYNVYDNLWNNSNNIMPKQGDFSFIVNKTISATLTYDYTMLNLNNLWELLNGKNKAILKATNFLFYNRHTPESLENNIFFLKYIYYNGWVEFVIKCLNG